MTAALDAVLAEAGRGGTPPNVLLMRFLGEAPTQDAARAALDGALATSTGVQRDRLAALDTLWAAHPQAWAVVRGVLADASHSPGTADPDREVGRWAGVFDRLAAASPEAGVALYALGDPVLLQQATAEIVDLTRRLGLLFPGAAVLDLGCGIGRLATALAPLAGSVLGLDVSSGMVAAARRNTRALTNVRVEQSDGHDLTGVADSTIDLVIAADVMPYVVQPGGTLAADHVAEFARVLRPGGSALLLNFSYRGDLAADRADLARYAAASGLRVEIAGTRDLALWDAPTFLLRK